MEPAVELRMRFAKMKWYIIDFNLLIYLFFTSDMKINKNKLTFTQA